MIANKKTSTNIQKENTSKKGIINPIECKHIDTRQYDVRESNVVDLGTIMDGNELEVIYFNQYVGSNSSIRSIDTDRSGVLQQYVRIHSFPIKLESELTYSYDSDTNVSSITGTGIVNNQFLMNTGDVFLYKINNTEYGLFEIDTSSRITYMNENLYSLSFKLTKTLPYDKDIGLIENETIKDLIKKTIRIYYYKTGCGCISENASVKYDELLTLFRDLANSYVVLFFDEITTGLVLVTENGTRILDHNPTTLFTSIVPRNIIRARDGYGSFTTNTETGEVNIYTMLRDRSKIGFEYMDEGILFKKHGMSVDKNTMYTHLNESIDYSVTTTRKPTNNELNIYPPDTDKDEEYFHSITENMYLFMNNKEGLLYGELLKFLENKTLEVETLHKLSLEIFKVDDIRKYYHIPLLLLLIKNIIKKQVNMYE